MTAGTRRGPAPTGQPFANSTDQGASDTPDDTRGRRQAGAILRLTGDLEAVAADLLDRIGPAACTALAVALAELLEGLR